MNDYSWGIGVGILIIAASIGRAVAVLIRAHAARIDRSDPVKPDPALGEALEEVRRRLGELEERQDFTDRLLAKQRDAERIAPPKS